MSGRGGVAGTLQGHAASALVTTVLCGASLLCGRPELAGLAVAGLPMAPFVANFFGGVGGNLASALVQRGLDHNRECLLARRGAGLRQTALQKALAAAFGTAVGAVGRQWWASPAGAAMASRTPETAALGPRVEIRIPLVLPSCRALLK